jgi:hypothetical protein
VRYAPILLAFSLGCARPPPSTPDETSTTNASGPGETSIPEETTGNVDASGPSDTTSTGPGCGFLGCDNESGPSLFECSIITDTCPAGQKCSAYATSGSTWNARRCVPVSPTPDGVDDPCSLETDPLSGVDTCARGAACLPTKLNADGTVAGRCVPTCTGTDSNPTCEDAWRDCHVGSDVVFAYCIPACSPLAPTAVCPPGRACIITDGYPDCTVVPADPPGAFEACTQSCAPGQHCSDARTVGLCPAESDSCCAPYCDLNNPACPDGSTCGEFFPPGMTPPGFEALGLCRIPE